MNGFRYSTDIISDRKKYSLLLIREIYIANASDLACFSDVVPIVDPSYEEIIALRKGKLWLIELRPSN